jgi:PadR family transcriptional regulator, regulatory protein PadR
MPARLRRSPQTLHVLELFLAAPADWRYGYDISRDTGVKSGTLYPILMRLEENGLLESDWETSQAGRPPRHVYRLTRSGQRAAREYVRAHAAHSTSSARLAGAEG